MTKYATALLLLLPLLSWSQQRVRPRAGLLRGPYLQAASANSIIIRWRTDVLVRGVVRYGHSAGQLDHSVQDSILLTEHKIKLEGLQPGTKYFYSIGSWKDTLQTGPDNYFSTLPLPGSAGHYRIGVVGDCGNNSVNQRNVRDQLVRYLDTSYMNAWILLGDNSYSTGRDAEFQSNFFNIYKETLLSKYPLFPAPGNHDYYDGDSAEAKVQKTHEIAYFQNFSMPVNGEAGGIASHTPAFYSFDLGNVHFLSLDSYGIEADQFRMYDTAGPQAQWVKKDLEANTNRGWVIAYWHHPPYTMGSHNSDHEQELVQIRENFIRILERYGVDLILCGHSHDYERSRLMKGHYGMEPTFDSTRQLISTSSGRYDGSPNSCPYTKEQDGPGTVYVVSGSAGQLGGKQASFPHDALPYSDATHGGAGILEIQGSQLDWKWVCADGEIRDRFTMVKRSARPQVITIKKGDSVTLTASFVGSYRWSKGGSTQRSITVSPRRATTWSVTDARGCIKDIFEVKVAK